MLVLAILCATLTLQAADDVAPRPADAFFAGIVEELTPEKIVVTRTVRGKRETREFRLQPDARIEGNLVVDARVTVRFITGDEGNLALLIVVRRGPRHAGRRKRN